MMIVDIKLCKGLQFAAVPLALILNISTQRCVAQTQSANPTTVATRHVSSSDETGNAGGGTNNNVAKTAAATKPDPEISLDIAKELAVMKARIDQLEAALKSRAPAEAATSTSVAGAKSASASGTEMKAPEPTPAAAGVDAAAQVRSGLPEKPKPTEPFAYADWTWLNGNPRNKDAVWDSKFFTPEIRMDVHYVMDLNHPERRHHGRLDRNLPVQ